MLPSISVSKELYTHLSDKGYSNGDIVGYVLNLKGEQKVPYQSSEPKNVSGINYRNSVLSVEDIKESHNILRKMSIIYNSDVLKKALESINIYSR